MDYQEWYITLDIKHRVASIFSRVSQVLLIVFLAFSNSLIFADEMSDEELLRNAAEQLLSPESEVSLEKAKELNDQSGEFLSKNKYSEALTVLVKSLEIKEKILGKEHLGTAQEYDNVGFVYYSMGDYSKALVFYYKALVVVEKAFGKEHPEVGSIYSAIAMAYYSMDDHAKALEFLNKELVIGEKVLGKDHLRTTTIYNNIGETYRSMGNYSKALEFLGKAIVVREKVLGKEHSETALSYHNLGLTYDSMGDYPKAIEFHHKALEGREKTLGKEHPSTLISYNSLGRIYNSIGNYPKALEFRSKALRVRGKILGKEHPDTAQSYNTIGAIYHSMGDYPKAIEFLNIALGVSEKIFGKDHPETAISHNNIGETYRSMGNHLRAIEFHNKALKVREGVLGKRHPDTASSYQNIGLTYHSMGDYSKALEFEIKALSVKEVVLGKEDPDTALGYDNIGRTYNSMGNYPKALEFANKALSVREKVFGKEHPDTALSYNSTGETYYIMGNYTKALEWHNKALEVRKKILDEGHPAIATSYNNIGETYRSLGLYSKALEFQINASNILEKTLGKEHPHTTLNYSNIGGVYSSMGNFPKAIEFHRKAYLAMEKTLGKEHPDTALSYNNVAQDYDSIGDYSNAKEFYNRAMLILEKFLGEEHPRTAVIYYNIANTNLATGNYSKALKFYNKALVILEKVMGKEHPHTALNYSNMGANYVYMGSYSKAYQFTQKAFTNFIGYRENSFSVLTMQQKKLYLKNNQIFIDNLLFGSIHYLTYLLKNNKPQAALPLRQATINDWLVYKGSILDSENRLLQLAKTSKDRVVKVSYASLVAAKKLYGELSQSSPDSTDEIEQWKAKLSTQADKIAKLEQIIVKGDPRFKDEKALQVINSQEIAKTLSSDSLYIDFAKTNDGYYLFTIDHQNTLSFNAYNKADSAAIDEAIIAFQTKMGAIANNQKLIKQPDDTTKQTLNTLHKLLFTKELLATLTDKTSLIISPDGALRLLPFEALFNEADNEYLIESKDIRYIASGKELVRLLRQNKDQTSNQNKAVLFANPDFGGKPSKQSADARGSDQIVTPNTHESRTLSLLESLQPNFKSLPGTQKEVDAIAKEIPHEAIKQGRDANEAYLLQVKQPNILHLATHGFFLKDIPNPMLKSGLILAGANRSLEENRGDGIVTALDLSGLDLQGTDLVVLSACETGKVDPNNTDGISGLSKAFIQAGAKDVVMSLWSVADDETAALMTAFYKAGKEDKQYAKALKESKLKLLDQGLHPYYWAAFVLSGL